MSSFDANNPTISIFTFLRRVPSRGPATTIAGIATLIIPAGVALAKDGGYGAYAKINFSSAKL